MRHNDDAASFRTAPGWAHRQRVLLFLFTWTSLFKKASGDLYRTAVDKARSNAPLRSLRPLKLPSGSHLVTQKRTRTFHGRLPVDSHGKIRAVHEIPTF